MNEKENNKKDGTNGLMSLMGRMSLIGLIGLIGPMGLMGCSGGGGEEAVVTPPPTTPTTPPTTPPTTTDVAISFSGYEEEGRTVSNGTNGTNRAYGRRAGTPLSEKAQSFTVWGYKNMSCNDQGNADPSDDDYGDLQTVFPGYHVNWINGSAASTTSNSSGWEYVAQQTGNDPEQTIKYWDMGAKAYRYFAVTGVPTYESNGFTMTADCSGATDQEIAANMAEAPFFSHLWFSTGNADYPTKQFGKAVQLEFLKPFARVRFLFNYSYAAEGVKVTNPSFKPSDGTTKIARKGTFKVTYPLTGTKTKEWYTIEKNPNPADGEELVAFTEEYVPEGTEKWYMVLPVNSQDSYTMTVTVKNVEKTAVVPAEYMTWLPGYSYTYIFKITEDGGVTIELVQVAVTAWTDMVITHTVYNW